VIEGANHASVTETYEKFAGPGYIGEIARRHLPHDLQAEVSRLVDPAAATETVHWGRNYLYVTELHTRSGPLEVVVKQFRNQGWWKVLDRRLRGSKAERGWRAAIAIADAGIPTPEPIVLVESDRRDGPSFFVSRRLHGASEVRHFFRRLNGESGAADFPAVDESSFLRQLGGFCRRLHDAGIWYRDLSMGNVLAVSRADEDLDLWLVDCNRARTGCRLGTVRRVRDLCRFPIVRPRHGDAFLSGYWGEVPPCWSARSWFWWLSVRGYLAKHAIKNRLRWLRLRRRHSHGAGHHAHLPEAARDASSRDKAVWDRLSDQPHQHASRSEKLAIRLADSPDHLRGFATVAWAAPGVWRRYRRLKADLYRAPIQFRGIGVCLRPWPDDPEALLAAVEELGVRSVLLRLHPWAADHRNEELLAAELHRRGFDIAFALPQNRELVRDRSRWKAAISEIAEVFTPYGGSFQVGQAPNRSKWGVWTLREYVDLYVDAAEILRRRPGIELMGPAVIDFEYQATLALVNRREPGLGFDVLSALLYVDRRGAPENRQLGLDTVDKAVLLRAISEIGVNSNGRCRITEVNWPLWEGPHSPAGKAVSVDEETQANYLTRYFALVLGTGLIERVYWWRLVARGYGLIAPEIDGRMRRRPAYRALQTLAAELAGTTFLGPLPAPEGAFMYRFERDGKEVVMGWSVEPGVTVTLPGVAARAIDRDGRDLPVTPRPDFVLGPSPVYFVLDAADYQAETSPGVI
jgi:tRNA A-37 threonylcarbamoyl transferase component Bud32